VEWRGVEIHPETPANGRPLAELFRQEDTRRMMEHLRVMGAQFGITFADRPFLSNSRMALQAAEFSREQGRFDIFHPALFAAYFSQGLDIGNLEVLVQIARDSGLDPAATKDAVQGGRYLPILAQAQEDASARGVTGVPAFYIGDKRSVSGAQPLEVFRKVLKSM
jgi:predicted DsbA family dithiol-disulfide isomerase